MLKKNEKFLSSTFSFETDKNHQWQWIKSVCVCVCVCVCERDREAETVCVRCVSATVIVKYSFLFYLFILIYFYLYFYDTFSLLPWINFLQSFITNNKFSSFSSTSSWQWKIARFKNTLFFHNWMYSLIPHLRTFTELSLVWHKVTSYLQFLILLSVQATTNRNTDRSGSLKANACFQCDLTVFFFFLRTYF